MRLPLSDLTPADEATLERWFHGDADATHDPRVAQLLDERPELIEFLRQLRAPRSVAEGRPSAAEGYAALTERRRTIEKHPGQGRMMRQGAVWSRAARRSLGFFVAAGLVLTVTFGIRYTQTRPRPQLRYTTTAAQCLTVRLPEGSRVVLAPNTSLTIAQDAIVLDGQAFFNVIPKTDRPFIVRTGTVVTRVLGTSFDVLYDRRAHTTRVVLVSGKVSTGARRSITLAANTMALVTDSSITSTTVVDPAPYVEWQTGRLAFHDAPVSDVLAAVERWYGVTVRVTDSAVIQQHLTATIDVRHSRDGTLATLASSLGVRLRVVADTVTLGPRVPGEPAPAAPRGAFQRFIHSTEVGR